MEGLDFVQEVERCHKYSISLSAHRVENICSSGVSQQNDIVENVGNNDCCCQLLAGERQQRRSIIAIHACIPFLSQKQEGGSGHSVNCWVLELILGCGDSGCG